MPLGLPPPAGRAPPEPQCEGGGVRVWRCVGGAHNSPLPLEFRTSPPEGVHRPTRSLSPPPKLFLADTDHLSTSTCEPPQVALAVANGNAVSLRKRHRHTHRPHNIQRPCLDFEKMQQVGSFLLIPNFNCSPVAAI